MKRTYKVSYRGPTTEGEAIVECEDFMEIGVAILLRLFPPKECPTVITKVELVNPEAHLRYAVTHQQEATK